jgi:hypothetical protein
LDHGTLELNDAAVAELDGKLHEGVGVVIVSKANMCTEQAREEWAILADRLKRGMVRNHFLSNFSAYDYTPDEAVPALES